MSLPELRQLRYFVAVAEQLSFTAAARELHLAQQSLSQQIAALERTLGVRLLDRDTRGTRLTEPGRLFLAEARAVLAAAGRAAATARRAGAGEVGRLRLAFLASTANYMLPLVVRTCREALPEVEVTAADLAIEPLVTGLREGAYDLAFTRPPLVADVATRTLAREPVCAVLPAGHRLAGRAGVSLAELGAEPWVLTPRASWPPWHEQYDRDFQAAGIEPAVVARAATVPNLLGLVAAGVGVTRLAASARTLRDTGVVFVPITGATAETVAAWCHPHPAAERLVALLADLAERTDLTAAG